ncbi:MAG: glutathione S-transferase family protein [Alphaproteobacteria bacterium]|nr:glutathione S-transferase family protein [Alphaproteobacteria bacterium]
MADVHIFGFPQSTYVRTARMACEEKGVAYEMVPADFGSDALLDVQPFNKIPGFSHGDVKLHETTAICVYVDETFDGPPLQPADTLAKAHMFQWISAACDYGYQYMIRELVLPRLVHPSRGMEPDEALIKASVPKIEHYLGIAEKTLSKSDYLAGDALSIADLMQVPCVFYISMTPEGQAMLPKYKGVSAWLERMSARPSFAATMPPPPPSQEAAE